MKIKNKENVVFADGFVIEEGSELIVEDISNNVLVCYHKESGRYIDLLAKETVENERMNYKINE